MSVPQYAGRGANGTISRERTPSAVRMSEGAIGSQIIRFAIPLFIGNLFQQLYSTVDALIVGNLLGNHALAAVTSVGSLVFMLIGFVEGVFIGASVTVSR